MKRSSIALVLALAVAACDVSLSVDPLTAPTVPTTTTTVVVTSTTVLPVPTTRRLPDLSDVAAQWTVSLRRAGPFQIGMTLEEAQAVAPTELIELEDADPACSFWTHDPATGIADDVRIMIRAGRIARIDMDGPLLRTLSGAGVGDPASAITSTYPGNIVQSRPPDGQPVDEYLTYIPDDASDIEFRIRFEVTAGVVTSYRIGVVPEVEWVNRCGD